MKNAIFLMGPTASGKTGAAIELAKRFPVELINVDSAQIYRGMDIGTAKPDTETLARCPHRLMNILDPAERYSAAQFREDALCEMREISAAGNIPLLVGGTGLYFRALEKGLAELPDADAEMREKIDTEAAQKGWPAMHAELAKVDPESAARISPNDPQRIQRALEVWRLTGRPLTAHWHQDEKTEFPYRLLKLAVAPAHRKHLHQRIEQRFEQMMKEGFLGEVRRLYERGDLSPDLPSIRAVGYRQLWAYLAGEISLEEAVRQGIVASRRYAKRQMTWLRGEADLEWFDSEAPDLPEQLARRVAEFLQKA